MNLIIDIYYEARASGHLSDPEGQQPVMPILEACYAASARSVKANENRYSIGSIENYLDDAEKPADGLTEQQTAMCSRLLFLRSAACGKIL